RFRGCPCRSRHDARNIGSLRHRLGHRVRALPCAAPGCARSRRTRLSVAGLKQRYSGIAILLHWALALLLLFQLGLGWALEDLPKSSLFVAFQFHKSVGI